MGHFLGFGSLLNALSSGHNQHSIREGDILRPSVILASDVDVYTPDNTAPYVAVIVYLRMDGIVHNKSNQAAGFRMPIHAVLVMGLFDWALQRPATLNLPFFSLLPTCGWTELYPQSAFLGDVPILR